MLGLPSDIRLHSACKTLSQTVQTWIPFVSSYLSGGEVYGHFYFLQLQWKQTNERPSYWDHHQSLSNCKDPLKGAPWVKQTSQTPPFVAKPFHSYRSICCSGSVFRPTLWTEGIKGLPPFVFKLWSATCKYQNKGSFLTLGDQHKPYTANCIFQVWMNDN